MLAVEPASRCAESRRSTTAADAWSQEEEEEEVEEEQLINVEPGRLLFASRRLLNDTAH